MFLCRFFSLHFYLPSISLVIPGSLLSNQSACFLFSLFSTARAVWLTMLLSTFHEPPRLFSSIFYFSGNLSIFVSSCFCALSPWILKVLIFAGGAWPVFGGCLLSEKASFDLRVISRAVCPSHHPRFIHSDTQYPV